MFSGGRLVTIEACRGLDLRAQRGMGSRSQMTAVKSSMKSKRLAAIEAEGCDSRYRRDPQKMGEWS